MSFAIYNVIRTQERDNRKDSKNVNRYKSLHGGGYQMGVGINKTSITHRIGYSAMQNDVAQPHRICTEQKTILRITNHA